MQPAITSTPVHLHDETTAPGSLAKAAQIFGAFQFYIVLGCPQQSQSFGPLQPRLVIAKQPLCL